ncbi:MAG: ferritin-like domain-containing protein, partial [Terriglobales bacterium]
MQSGIVTKAGEPGRDATGRRAFLKKAGAGGLAVAAVMATSAPRLLAQATTTPVTDVDILNFALNLEYLEAEFYTMATIGKHIDQLGIGVSGMGTQGATTGGQKVDFSNNMARNAAVQIASDEQAHVRLLRTALGTSAVAKPAINLGALGIGFGNQSQFLQLARAFEDTGVSAYGGAAP